MRRTTSPSGAANSANKPAHFNVRASYLMETAIPEHVRVSHLYPDRRVIPGGNAYRYCASSQDHDSVNSLTQRLISELRSPLVSQNVTNVSRVLSPPAPRIVSPSQSTVSSPSSSTSGSLATTMPVSLPTHCQLPALCFGCQRSISQADTPILGPFQCLYHAACFRCSRCSRSLATCVDYTCTKKELLCAQCVSGAFENCFRCGLAINERVLRALGKPYHPVCFVCFVCGQCLDGRAFTLDVLNRTYCLRDFHARYAPRCALCAQHITPMDGQTECCRVVCGDDSYHLSCFERARAIAAV